MPTNLILVLISGIFMLVGVVLIAIGILNLSKARASAGWPSTTGKVTSSQVRVDTSTDNEGSTSTSYVPAIQYEYAVNKTQYTSSRRTVGSGQMGYGSRNRANAIVEQYPAGKSVSVYYDPKNPKYAVLQTGVSSSVYVWLLMGIAFIALPPIFAMLFTPR